MSLEANNNVVSMEEALRAKRKKQEEGVFKRYLKSLKTDQLHQEATFLLNKFQNDVLTEDALNKCMMLLDELAKRVDEKELSANIKAFATNIRLTLVKNHETH